MRIEFNTDHVLAPEIRARMEFLETLAQKDPLYMKMFGQYQKLEARFRSIEGDIPPEYRDIIWDYFGICDDMTRRITELACEYITLTDMQSEY